MKYISFTEYKEKIKENAKVQAKSESLTDEQVIEHGLKIMRAYEKNQQKAGERDGDI